MVSVIGADDFSVAAKGPTYDQALTFINTLKEELAQSGVKACAEGKSQSWLGRIFGTSVSTTNFMQFCECIDTKQRHLSLTLFTDMRPASTGASYGNAISLHIELPSHPASTQTALIYCNFQDGSFYDMPYGPHGPRTVDTNPAYQTTGRGWNDRNKAIQEFSELLYTYGEPTLCHKLGKPKPDAGPSLKESLQTLKP